MSANFVSIPQAAKILESTQFYVRQLIAAGDIPAAERHTLISIEALHRFKRVHDRGRFHANHIGGIHRARKQDLAGLNET